MIPRPTIPVKSIMKEYYLRNLIGNPTETAIAGARLLFSGVLERFPGLRIILSHGGGSLPHISGRLRHGFAVRPEARERARDPLAQLGRLFYDTIVFDPLILRHLVAVVGASQVVLGTDYPFDMGEEAPVAFVRQAGLAAPDCDAILNAADRIIRDKGVGQGGESHEAALGGFTTSARSGIRHHHSIRHTRTRSLNDLPPSDVRTRAASRPPHCPTSLPHR
jgi:hypothetical protein